MLAVIRDLISTHILDVLRRAPMYALKQIVSHLDKFRISTWLQIKEWLHLRYTFLYGPRIAQIDVESTSDPHLTGVYAAICVPTFTLNTFAL